MTQKVVKGDETQIDLDSILDEVTAGHVVLIERNKKIGVIVPFARWQHAKKLLDEEIAQIRKAMDAGDYLTWEVVKADLKAANHLS